MSESISKKEEIERTGMEEEEEEEEEDINIDLNDHFNYTLGDDGGALGLPSPIKKNPSPSHLLRISSTITAANNEESGPSSSSSSTAGVRQLNNFEKLLQTNHLLSDMTQLTQSHPPSVPSNPTASMTMIPAKNFYDKIQDRHEEYFLTTQVDYLKPLRHLNDLQVTDFISSSNTTERGGKETSLQACVAMLFGFKLNDLSQNGGPLPALSTQDPSFEHQLDQWIALHTHCNSHLIPFSIFRDSSLEIQGGRLCILYGMMSTQSPRQKHCFVGYLEVNTSSQSLQVRCILDPSDPNCINHGHKISQNSIQLELIDWVLCFTDAADAAADNRESPFGSHNHNHHTEVLSLEESGLFTQEEQHEQHKPSEDHDQEATDSYLKLAQSTVDHDPSLHAVEEEMSSDNQILEKTSPMPKSVPEEPTEIIPIEEMTNYLNPRPETPPPPNSKAISLALSPPSEGNYILFLSCRLLISCR
jgi:hypothetical protein